MLDLKVFYFLQKVIWNLTIISYKHRGFLVTQRFVRKSQSHSVLDLKVFYFLLKVIWNLTIELATNIDGF